MDHVLKYERSHEDALIALLKNEPDWSAFTNDAAIGPFKEALLNNDSYICECRGEVCGYVRALVDAFGVYVSELYVAPRYRNQGYGKALLEQVRKTHPDQDVYVLSDEDAYYEKLGYARAGSVFHL